MIGRWRRKRTLAEHEERIRQLELGAGVGTHDWLPLVVKSDKVRFYDPGPGDEDYALCPGCPPPQPIGWIGGVLADAIAMQCPKCERWFRNPRYPLAVVSLDGEVVLAEDGGPVTRIERMRCVMPGEIIDLTNADSDQVKADASFAELMTERVERHLRTNYGQVYAPIGTLRSTGAPGEVIEYDPKHGPPFQGAF